MGKFYRSLRREHLGKSVATTLIAVGAGAAVATGGVPLVAIAVCSAFAGLVGMGCDFSVRDNSFTCGERNSSSVNEHKLVGHRRDIHSVVRVQKLIEAWTWDYQHLSVLPSKLHAKIMKHIRDVTPAVARLRIYQGAQAKTFPFRRSFISADNHKSFQHIAVIDLKPIEMLEGPEPVALSLPVNFVSQPVKSLPASDTLRIQFNPEGDTHIEIARLQKRLEALEQQQAPARIGLKKET